MFNWVMVPSGATVLVVELYHFTTCTEDAMVPSRATVLVVELYHFTTSTEDH